MGTVKGHSERPFTIFAGQKHSVTSDGVCPQTLQKQLIESLENIALMPVYFRSFYIRAMDIIGKDRGYEGIFILESGSDGSSTTSQNNTCWHGERNAQYSTGG